MNSMSALAIVSGMAAIAACEVPYATSANSVQNCRGTPVPFKPRGVRTGRNEACICGSGEKFKNCCRNKP